MKQNYRRLELLIAYGIIDPTDFYVIQIEPRLLKFQGHLKSEVVERLIKKGFTFTFDNDWIMLEGTDRNIQITLT